MIDFGKEVLENINSDILERYFVDNNIDVILKENDKIIIKILDCYLIIKYHNTSMLILVHCLFNIVTDKNILEKVNKINSKYTFIKCSFLAEKILCYEISRSYEVCLNFIQFIEDIKSFRKIIEILNEDFL